MWNDGSKSNSLSCIIQLMGAPNNLCMPVFIVVHIIVIVTALLALNMLTLLLNPELRPRNVRRVCAWAKGRSWECSNSRPRTYYLLAKRWQVLILCIRCEFVFNQIFVLKLIHMLNMHALKTRSNHLIILISYLSFQISHLNFLSTFWKGNI